MENKQLTKHLGELFHLMHQYETLDLQNEHHDILTPSELHIVDSIGLTENKTSKEIGEELGITKGAVSQQIKKLIENKIVKKEISETDKRVSYLVLTEKGRSFYKEHQEIKKIFEKELEENLNDTEMKGFLNGVELLNRSLLNRVKAGKKNEG